MQYWLSAEANKRDAMQGAGEERTEVYLNTPKEYRSRQRRSALEAVAVFRLSRKQAAAVVSLAEA